MPYVEYNYGHNKKEIRKLHFNQGKLKNTIKQKERKLEDVKAKLRGIEQQLAALMLNETIAFEKNDEAPQQEERPRE